MHPLVSGFYDTPFVTWLLKTQTKYNSKVYFENELGMNRHWLEMLWGREEVDTLVTHYAGAPPPGLDYVTLKPAPNPEVLKLLCSGGVRKWTPCSPPLCRRTPPGLKG